MSEAAIRRTWPCRYQESITVKLSPWTLGSFKVDDDNKPRPCPVHGPECGRLA